MSKILNVGVIGVGHIGRSHLQQYTKNSRVKIVAIADINKEVLAEVKKEFGVPQSFTDYRRLLRLKRLHAVSICTPPFAHAENTLAAAKSGKHVLCEKPMAMNATEAFQMVAACRKARVLLGIASGRARLHNEVRAAKKIVDSGALGRIYYGRVSTYRRRGRPGMDILVNSKWFLDSRKAGGGALADIGCYDIDVMLYLLNSPQPKTVSAFTHRGLPHDLPRGVRFDVEEHASALVRFQNGLVVIFETTWAANMGNGDGFRLFGTRGGLQSGPLRLFSEQGGVQLDCSAQVGPGGGWDGVVNDFVEACLEHRAPITPGEDGLKGMQIIEGAYRSAAMGKEVAIP